MFNGRKDISSSESRDEQLLPLLPEHQTIPPRSNQDTSSRQLSKPLSRHQNEQTTYQASSASSSKNELSVPSNTNPHHGSRPAASKKSTSPASSSFPVSSLEKGTLPALCLSHSESQKWDSDQDSSPPSSPPLSHHEPSPSELLGMKIDSPLSKDEFRMLVGSLGYPMDERRYRIPKWLRPNRHHSDSELNVGLYEKIVSEERRTTHLYRLYNTLLYGGYIMQLIISAMLVLLGAIPSDQHMVLSILGAVNGVITGILSLIRGQGLPMRLLRYLDGLRSVREEIEWLEKEITTGKRQVLYSEVVRLRVQYGNLRSQIHQSHPDTWSPPLPPSQPKGPSLPLVQIPSTSKPMASTD